MIRVGTCSWAEKTLLASGEFYPPDVRTAEARLRYYAARFDTVEIDSTYYAIPDQRTAWLWDVRTPVGFTFHVKVYGALTGHAVDPRTLPADLRDNIGRPAAEGRSTYIRDRGVLLEISKRFMEAVLPLARAGKLGLMVYQFPPWFDYKEANLDYLLFCKELTKDARLAVEFRHGSWLTSARSASVFNFLRKNDIIYIAADEPQYGSLATIPFIPQATGDIAYFRFHGRNAGNWLRKNVETSLRYAYSYNDEELRSFVAAVKQADNKAKETYAMFNNCHRGSATTNATRLKELIETWEERG